MTPLAGHTISYHSHSFEDALAGIAHAGFRSVELAAVPGGPSTSTGLADAALSYRYLAGLGLS